MRGWLICVESRPIYASLRCELATPGNFFYKHPYQRHTVWMNGAEICLMMMGWVKGLCHNESCKEKRTAKPDCCHWEVCTNFHAIISLLRTWLQVTNSSEHNCFTGNLFLLTKSCKKKIMSRHGNFDKLNVKNSHSRRTILFTYVFCHQNNRSKLSERILPALTSYYYYTAVHILFVLHRTYYYLRTTSDQLFQKCWTWLIYPKKIQALSNT